MSNFKVSVIIPMFNSEGTIIETRKSRVNQTRADLIEEIIIVNDGSTDGSKQTVEQYINESKHTFIKMFHKQNGGVSSARNFGVEQANAEWIAFCDSDDIWLENKLEIQIQALKENKEIAKRGGDVAKVTKEKLEQEFGEEVITNKNNINLKYIDENNKISSKH